MVFNNMNKQVRDVLVELEKLEPIDDSVKSLRENFLNIRPLAGKPEIIAKIENRTIPGPQGPIPIRIYRPSLKANLPVAVFLHGGWFYMGDLETHDAPMRSLANAAECVVVAVDYRLAPEHPFPAGPDDAYAATVWVAEHARELGVDPDKLSVIGESAGGGLAAVVALRARDLKGPKISLQVLIYPATDATFESPTWEEFAEGPVLTYEGALYARSLYLPKEADWTNPEASPLLAPNLEGLPPALVITAEYDPLRDEGEAYARALERAGNDVLLSRYPGMIHGFFLMAGRLDAGHDCIQEIAKVLKLVNRVPEDHKKCSHCSC